jgi:PEP-CTERM motif
MNTLRILSLVCGASGIKRLSGLLILLLLWPAFASAACLPSPNDILTQECFITSGTASYQFPDSFIDFHFAGDGFSGTGSFLLPEDNPISFVQPPGPFQIHIGINNDFDFANFPSPMGDTGYALVLTELTFNGVPLPLPGPTGLPAAGIEFESFVPLIKGAGTFSGSFFSDVFYGDTHGNVLGFVGNDLSTTTVDVVPYPPVPGLFEITHETWTWKVPEPTTLSLFALGLVGVGFMRRRNKS